MNNPCPPCPVSFHPPPERDQQIVYLLTKHACGHVPLHPTGIEIAEAPYGTLPPLYGNPMVIACLFNEERLLL